MSFIFGGRMEDFEHGSFVRAMIQNHTHSLFQFMVVDFESKKGETATLIERKLLRIEALRQSAISFQSLIEEADVRLELREFVSSELKKKDQVRILNGIELSRNELLKLFYYAEEIGYTFSFFIRDAERFYAKCAEIESRWQPYAILWLGDYYLDSAQGDDPEIAIEYLESIANNNVEAAGKLSDYYWNLIMPEYFEDIEWRSQLFKWTSVAAKLNPEEYSYRMGCIYADGIGCEQSYDKAYEFLQDAYLHGDAKSLDDFLRQINDTFQNDKKKN